MNDQVRQIFTSKEWFSCSSKKGWFEKPLPGDELLAVDVCKHYSDCITSATQPWCVYDIYNEVRPFNPCFSIRTGFYYVETSDVSLFAGNDWYCEERVQLGLDDSSARQLVLQTALGAARLAVNSEDDPATLRHKVTSPGGTTAAAIDVFERANFIELVGKALTAARDRSLELSGN